MTQATQTQTLAGFLLARIAEDEAVARAVPEVEAKSGAAVFTSLLEPTGTVEVSPARVLAECEAKRRIVEDCEELLTKDVEYNERFGRASLARGFLRTLAVPYADHDDYREEWRP